MKKIILSLAVVATGFWAQSQVICAGVSPANIAGNYGFTWADPAGADWSTPDFLIPGTFVEDTLMIVDDGTPGLNPQGNPMSAEACNGPLINDLTGKIAVIYRNTCEFGYKALQAQNAGAVGVIIVNREDALVNMGGGVEGLNVTIPVVFISSLSGNTIITEMGNGPVVMFLGNKVGAFANDVGANAAEMLISTYGGANSIIFDGFPVGIQFYNFGSNSQSNVTVTANIDGPGAPGLYNQVINAPMMNTGDTLSIFTGNTYSFPDFNLGLGNYPPGVYTLTYTLDLGIADDSDFDNMFTWAFTVNPDVVSLSPIDGALMPTSNNYPSNSEGEYQSCMFFMDANASSMTIDGIYLVPHMDTASQLVGEEIFININEWNDGWVDLNDPNYGLVANDFFQAVNTIVFETYYPAAASENDMAQYVPLTAPLSLVDNQRYLVCLQTFNPEVAFGYDSQLNYDGNQGITAMPIAPVGVEQTGVLNWYTGGWSGQSATSIGLKVTEVGIEELSSIEGMAYPNPAKDVVTVSIEANGSANLTITDVSGKVAGQEVINLIDGKAEVNISSLEDGVYVFNVTFEDGQTSQFNVVKK